MSYFYELTEYPRIFKKSYWGTFDTKNRTETEMGEIMEIINNRNEFIKDFLAIKGKTVEGNEELARTIKEYTYKENMEGIDKDSDQYSIFKVW